MAFVALNNYDVEVASSKVVYENLFPTIQHINGKGCIDTYTKTDDVMSIYSIDVMRVLPFAPRFRKLGSTNNGAWHNKNNEGGFNNAPQSLKYQVPVDLLYDEGVAINSSQIYSNPVALQEVVMKQIVESAGMAINVITYAKQIEAFFRNGDNFDKALTNTKGSVVAANITEDEIASAVFAYDPTVAQTAPDSAVNAWLNANEELNDGIPEIGAFVVPVDERQGFVTPKLNRLIKSQYLTNASDKSVGILGSGFINPFTQSEGNRIDSRTGMCGTYDGVDMFLLNKVTRNFTYVALGVAGTANDNAGNLPTVRAALDKLNGLIVYGAGTLRGIAGPSVTANPNTYFGGVYILPQMKVGVEVIHGGTIKAIVNGGEGLADAWTADTIATMVNTITFTPIDGAFIKGNMTGFNDGTSN